MIVKNIVIQSTGSALPKRCMDNDTLAQTEHLDTSDEWIRTRTGIRQRFLSGADETTSSLAIDAAKRALANAQIDPTQLQMIVLATSTPDEVFPPTATSIQAALGAHHAIAFDINVACSGFVFGLAMVESYMRLAGLDKALLIGSETMSRIVDWSDRSTAVLFGDGAGAVVLSTTSDPERGLQGHVLRTDGQYHNSLYVNGGISTTQTVGHICMDGTDVFRHAVTQLANVTRDLMTQHNLDVDQVDWVIPHQANKRILSSLCDKLGFDKEKMLFTGDQHANTSAASIPLAWDYAHKQGWLRPGQRVILQSFGAGFTWGGYLLRL